MGDGEAGVGRWRGWCQEDGVGERGWCRRSCGRGSIPYVFQCWHCDRRVGAAAQKLESMFAVRHTHVFVVRDTCATAVFRFLHVVGAWALALAPFRRFSGFTFTPHPLHIHAPTLCRLPCQHSRGPLVKYLPRGFNFQRQGPEIFTPTVATTAVK